MKTVIINGQNHKGSTYHIGKLLADKIGGEVTEFFLPRDFSDYCIGCAQCFSVAADKCPKYKKQQLLLFSTYVYIFSPERIKVADNLSKHLPVLTQTHQSYTI